MNVQRLQIVAQQSGKQVGWIALAGDAVAFSDTTAKKIFSTYKGALAADDRKTFATLATGWSNGYLTIPAVP